MSANATATTAAGETGDATAAEAEPGGVAEDGEDEFLAVDEGFAVADVIQPADPEEEDAEDQAQDNDVEDNPGEEGELQAETALEEVQVFHHQEDEEEQGDQLQEPLLLQDDFDEDGEEAPEDHDMDDEAVEKEQAEIDQENENVEDREGDEIHDNADAEADPNLDGNKNQEDLQDEDSSSVGDYEHVEPFHHHSVKHVDHDHFSSGAEDEAVEQNAMRHERENNTAGGTTSRNRDDNDDRSAKKIRTNGVEETGKKAAPAGIPRARVSSGAAATSSENRDRRTEQRKLSALRILQEHAEMEQQRIMDTEREHQDEDGIKVVRGTENKQPRGQETEAAKKSRRSSYNQLQYRGQETEAAVPDDHATTLVDFQVHDVVELKDGSGTPIDLEKQPVSVQVFFGQAKPIRAVAINKLQLKGKKNNRVDPLRCTIHEPLPAVVTVQVSCAEYLLVVEDTEVKEVGSCIVPLFGGSRGRNTFFGGMNRVEDQEERTTRTSLNNFYGTLPIIDPVEGLEVGKLLLSWEFFSSTDERTSAFSEVRRTSTSRTSTSSREMTKRTVRIKALKRLVGRRIRQLLDVRQLRVELKEVRHRRAEASWQEEADEKEHRRRSRSARNYSGKKKKQQGGTNTANVDVNGEEGSDFYEGDESTSNTQRISEIPIQEDDEENEQQDGRGFGNLVFPPTNASSASSAAGGSSRRNTPAAPSLLQRLFPAVFIAEQPHAVYTAEKQFERMYTTEMQLKNTLRPFCFVSLVSSGAATTGAPPAGGTTSARTVTGGVVVGAASNQHLPTSSLQSFTTPLCTHRASTELLRLDQFLSANQSYGTDSLLNRATVNAYDIFTELSTAFEVKQVFATGLGFGKDKKKAITELNEGQKESTLQVTRSSHEGFFAKLLYRKWFTQESDLVLQFKHCRSTFFLRGQAGGGSFGDGHDHLLSPLRGTRSSDSSCYKVRVSVYHDKMIIGEPAEIAFGFLDVDEFLADCVLTLHLQQLPTRKLQNTTLPTRQRGERERRAPVEQSQTRQDKAGAMITTGHRDEQERQLEELESLWSQLLYCGDEIQIMETAAAAATASSSSAAADEIIKTAAAEHDEHHQARRHQVEDKISKLLSRAFDLPNVEIPLYSAFNVQKKVGKAVLHVTHVRPETFVPPEKFSYHRELKAREKEGDGRKRLRAGGGLISSSSSAAGGAPVKMDFYRASAEERAWSRDDVVMGNEVNAVFYKEHQRTSALEEATALAHSVVTPIPQDLLTAWQDWDRLNVESLTMHACCDEHRQELARRYFYRATSTASSSRGRSGSRNKAPFRCANCEGEIFHPGVVAACAGRAGKEKDAQGSSFSPSLLCLSCIEDFQACLVCGEEFVLGSGTGGEGDNTVTGGPEAVKVIRKKRDALVEKSLGGSLFYKNGRKNSTFPPLQAQGRTISSPLLSYHLRVVFAKFVFASAVEKFLRNVAHESDLPVESRKSLGLLCRSLFLGLELDEPEQVGQELLLSEQGQDHVHSERRAGQELHLRTDNTDANKASSSTRKMALELLPRSTAPGRGLFQDVDHVLADDDPGLAVLRKIANTPAALQANPGLLLLPFTSASCAQRLVSLMEAYSDTLTTVFLYKNVADKGGRGDVEKASATSSGELQEQPNAGQGHPRPTVGVEEKDSDVSSNSRNLVVEDQHREAAFQATTPAALVLLSLAAILQLALAGGTRRSRSNSRRSGPKKLIKVSSSPTISTSVAGTKLVDFEGMAGTLSLLFSLLSQLRGDANAAAENRNPPTSFSDFHSITGDDLRDLVATIGDVVEERHREDVSDRTVFENYFPSASLSTLFKTKSVRLGSKPPPAALRNKDDEAGSTARFFGGASSPGSSAGDEEEDHHINTAAAEHEGTPGPPEVVDAAQDNLHYLTLRDQVKLYFDPTSLIQLPESSSAFSVLKPERLATLDTKPWKYYAITVGIGLFAGFALATSVAGTAQMLHLVLENVICKDHAWYELASTSATDLGGAAASTTTNKIASTVSDVAQALPPGTNLMLQTTNKLQSYLFHYLFAVPVRFLFKTVLCNTARALRVEKLLDFVGSGELYVVLFVLYGLMNYNQASQSLTIRWGEVREIALDIVQMMRSSCPKGSSFGGDYVVGGGGLIGGGLDEDDERYGVTIGTSGDDKTVVVHEHEDTNPAQEHSHLQE
ncbi:unnamed protein product, partial [Amoebophrya sp. A120]|eukprot:GSA120T00016431001.1